MPNTNGERKAAFIVRSGSVTVSAYGPDARNRYTLAFYRHAGDDRQREIKTGERAARVRAKEIAENLANGRAEILELAHSDRESYLHARALLTPFSVPLHSVVEEWVAARKILQDMPLVEAANIVVRSARTTRAVPAAEQILIELLGEVADLQRSKATHKWLNNDLRPFLAKYPRLETVTTAHVVEYLRELVAGGVGPRRRDNIRDAIVRLFRFARQHNYLPEDRRSEPEKVRRIKPTTEVETWLPVEAATILEHTHGKWIPFMALGMFAGLRTSEIFRLQWSAIKFDQGVIAVSASVARKIRISRLVPIQDNLLAWLKPYAEKVGPIYPGSPKTNEKNVCRERVRIEKATGIAWRNNANRHSFGSYRLAVAKAINQVALEMGNSAAKVRENYNDPKPEAEGQKYFALMPPSESENIVSLPLEF